MTVTLTVNGSPHSGWKDIVIERSMEAIAGAFSLGITERWADNPNARTINRGDECSVKIGSDVVVTGYVDTVTTSIDAETHSLGVTGRDKAADLNDCSAINNPGTWLDQKLEKIAQQLTAPFNISVTTNTNTGKAFKKFSIQQGETVFEALQRLCKLRAVLMLPDKQGNLIITTAASTRAATALVEGQNILEASGKLDNRDRFSLILVKGQSSGSDNSTPPTIAQAKGKANDTDVSRYRPLLVIAEGQADVKTCQDRAQWEARNRKAKAQSFTVTVQGWYQDGNNTLWDMNQLTHLNSPSLKANGVYLISGVRYTLSEDQGTKTELTLVDPASFELIRGE